MFYGHLVTIYLAMCQVFCYEFILYFFAVHYIASQTHNKRQNIVKAGKYTHRFLCCQNFQPHHPLIASSQLVK